MGIRLSGATSPANPGDGAGGQVLHGEIVSPAAGEAVGEVGRAGGGTKVQAFTFGEPTQVHDRRELLGYVECAHNGRWYEPPVSPHGLARAFDIAPHHASAIRLKVNLLTRAFRPSRWLDRTQFRKFALDLLVQGNAYLERRDNLARRPLRLEHSLARYTRRGIEDGRFFFVPGWRQEHEFEPGTVFHLFQEHPTQEIYGIPEYMAALQSALLNEAATLFRRRYYLNGSHAGFVFYASGTAISNEDADGIREAMRQSKGPGNFRNLFLHAPNGGKDDIKIMPISEIAAKDEFIGIKETTRDDMLAAHRVPPQLIGVIPANAALGPVDKASDMFHLLEIEPLEGRCLEVNDWLGVEAVAFDPYQPVAAAAAA